MGKARKIESVVVEEISKLDPDQKALVLAWSRDAKVIVDNKQLKKSEKLAQLQKLKTLPVVAALLQNIAQRAKIKLWDERGWPARMALGGLALGLAVTGTKAAGIAAAGTAIAVKVYLLTSAGGALLGTLIQELEKSSKK